MVFPGSILRPLLFTVCINSLPEVINNSETLLHDDTATITTGSIGAEISINMGNAINAVSDWLNNHKLSLNVQKTKCMYLGTLG